jgi:hypothetical protein
MTDDKKSLYHEDYRMPGTNAFNLSKWSRENEPKAPPRYKVGDYVVLVVSCEITRVYQDCDGTPLYTLDGDDHGHSDDSLLPGADGDWKLEALELAEIAAQRERSRPAPKG